MHESEVAPLIHDVSAEQRGTYLKAYVALYGDGYLPVDVVATGESADGAREAALKAFRTFTGRVEARGKHWRLMDAGDSGLAASSG